MKLFAKNNGTEFVLDFQVEKTLSALVFGENNENIQSAWGIDGIKNICVIDDDEDSTDFVKIRIKAGTEEAAEKAKNKLFYLHDSFKVPLAVLDKFVEFTPEHMQKSSTVCAISDEKGKTPTESEVFICGTQAAVELVKFLVNNHVTELMTAESQIDEDSKPVDVAELMTAESQIDEDSKLVEQPVVRFKSFRETRENMSKVLNRIETNSTDYARQTDVFAKSTESKFPVVPRSAAVTSAEQSGKIKWYTTDIEGYFSPVFESTVEKIIEKCESCESVNSSVVSNQQANTSSKEFATHSSPTDQHARETRRFPTTNKEGSSGSGNGQLSAETETLITQLSSFNGQYARETDTFAKARRNGSHVSESVASTAKYGSRTRFAHPSSLADQEIDAFATTKQRDSPVTGSVASPAKSESSITCLPQHSSSTEQYAQQIDTLATTNRNDVLNSGNLSSSSMESVGIMTKRTIQRPSPHGQYARGSDTFATATKKSSSATENVQSFAASGGRTRTRFGQQTSRTPDDARKSDSFAERSNVTVPSCGSVILSPNPYDDFETGGSSCCNSASGNRRNNCEGSSERYMDDLDRPRCEEAYQMC